MITLLLILYKSIWDEVWHILPEFGEEADYVCTLQMGPCLTYYGKVYSFKNCEIAIACILCYARYKHTTNRSMHLTRLFHSISWCINIRHYTHIETHIVVFFSILHACWEANLSANTVYTIEELSNQLYFLPPARFWKRREVLFWVRSPSPPSPPSPRMFCLISRLLLKLAFWNLACAIYAKTILLKCF